MAVLCAATRIAVLGCLSRSVVHHIVTGVLDGLQAGSGSLRRLLSVLSFPQGNRNDYMNRKYSLSGQMLHPFAQLVLVLISCFIPVRSSGMKVKPFFFHAISLSCCAGREWERISREKHCLQPGIVPDAAWSACGHLRQVSWASCIILGILGKTKLFNLLLGYCIAYD